MEVVCDDPRLIKLNSTRAELQSVKTELQECRGQVQELKNLQTEFYSQLSSFLKGGKMDKENQVIVSVTLTDSETQTSYEEGLAAPPPRRWNSDLSLDLDGKSQGKRYNKLERNDLTKFCLSTEAMMAPPIIRIQGSQQSKSRSKFTNRLDVGGPTISSKRQADHLLLSDLGLTSQAPEFSQSEFNLSSDDHWLSNQKQSGGRVRFLSHEGGQHGQAGINNMEDEEDDCLDLEAGMPHNHIFHSHSGSWATLTHSERDLSEMDSCLSLNHQDIAGAIDAKPYLSSTPYKGLRSKFKQSVSFHDLLPSKAVHCCSMPNLPKQNAENATRRNLPLSGNMENSTTNSKRHSFNNMDQRSQSFTTTRRSSLTGNIENGPYVPSAIGSLFLGGRVKALHSGQVVVTGIVWYRGKLPGISEDVVGIELDQVGLGGDGTFQGHRYFRCAPGRGLFVPFRKIIMAWPTQ